MSLSYRTDIRDYDCEIELQIPIDLLEDLQAKADARNLRVDQLIIQTLAKSCERAQKQIRNQP